MKRNLWLKVLALFVVLCMCFSLVACEVSDNEDNDNNTGGEDNIDKNVNGEVSESLTVDELVDFHENGAKYPDNFVFEELTGYGRVMESTSSQEEALSMAKEYFTNGSYVAVEYRLTVETDLFYGIYVKWAYQSDGTIDMSRYHDECVVSFKKSVFDYSFGYDYSGEFVSVKHNMQFFTQDKGAIKSILDYYLYSRTYQTYGEKIYSTNINLQGDKYVYTAYILQLCFGDWGMQDGLSLIKRVIDIDLATGIAETNDEVIGEVYIDGAFTHYDW